MLRNHNATPLCVSNRKLQQHCRHAMVVALPWQPKPSPSLKFHPPGADETLPRIYSLSPSASAPSGSLSSPVTSPPASAGASGPAAGAPPKLLSIAKGWPSPDSVSKSSNVSFNMELAPSSLQWRSRPSCSAKTHMTAKRAALMQRASTLGGVSCHGACRPAPQAAAAMLTRACTPSGQSMTADWGMTKCSSQ